MSTEVVSVAIIFGTASYCSTVEPNNTAANVHVLVHLRRALSKRKTFTI